MHIPMLRRSRVWLLGKYVAIEVIGELSACSDDGASPGRLNLNWHMSTLEWRKRTRGCGTERQEKLMLVPEVQHAAYLQGGWSSRLSTDDRA